MFIFGGPDGETEWFIFGRDEAALQVTLSIRPLSVYFWLFTAVVRLFCGLVRVFFLLTYLFPFSLSLGT